MKKNSSLIALLSLIFVIGCKQPNSASKEEEKIDVMAAWTAGPELVTGVNEGSLVAHNGFLYHIGGVVDWTINYTSLIQRAVINTDGSLGSWEIISNLPESSAGHTAFIKNNYMYVINCPYGDVRAPVNADGSLGSWMTLRSGTNRPSATSVAVTDSMIYRLGGWVVADPDLHYHNSISSVYRSEISDSNTISSWENDLKLTSARDYFASIVYNGYLYVFGGHHQGANGTVHEFLDYVETAKINSDGSLESWVSQTSLPTTAHSIEPIVYKDKVYLLTRDMPYIMFADLKDGGQVGEWKTASTAFPADVHHTACVYGKFVYVVGGTVPGDENGTGDKRVFYTSFLD